jgi:hypothetical protein
MVWRLARPCLACVAAALVVGVGAGSAPAQGPSPWWALSSGARPTFLPSGLATSEVQELTATETVFVGTQGAAFTLSVNKHVVGTFATEPLAKTLEFEGPEPTPENIQTALEGEEAYGKGNVAVSGAHEGATLHFVIRSLHKGPVPELEVTPNVGTATTKVTSEGKPDGEVIVTAENLGDAPTTGPVTVTDKLPPGLKALGIEKAAGELAGHRSASASGCSLAALSCTFSGSLPAPLQIELRIPVEVLGASAHEPNRVSVTGGGAPPASLVRELTLSSAPTPFGVEDYAFLPEEPGGTLDTQAGSHPFQLTTRVTLNQTSQVIPAALPKDVSLKIPPGLVANSTALPRCALGQFLNLVERGFNDLVNECAPDTAVGVALVTVNLTGSALQFLLPVFNITPSVGEPVRFGFMVNKGRAPVLIDTSVRTGEDYGATVSVHGISQTVGFLASTVIIWGVPGDPAHDSERGWACVAETLGEVHGIPCQPAGESHPPAFLSLPTSCPSDAAGRPIPLLTSIQADSWLQPGVIGASLPALEGPPAIDGCNQLPFSPSISVAPDTAAASSSSGLTVDVHVNQDAALNGESLAESAVRSITVALPQGVAINPAGGDGLQACSQGLVGFTGFREIETEPGVSNATFTPALPEPFEQGVNFCPDAAKIGTVRISSPLLPKGQDLAGSVYLAAQNQNPFGSLLAMYIVARDPVSGVLVKLPGEVHLSESGQIVTTFKNTPQLAFEDAELHFFGGERAPLSTPAHCGAYTTNAWFVPWSAEPSDEAALTVHASSTFNITSGPNGSPCPGPSLPFSPSLTGGMTNINAGSFSPLTTTIGRPDGDQDMQSVALHMPPGLSGLLSNVRLCPEQQANEGTCGPESLIGETTVSAGVGSDPVSVKGGKVYLTEHYAGAPFGLSIVNPVKAGPIDLEHDTSNQSQQPACDCVVVRAKIEVDPHTAALTVTTDPSGPHAIPHMIDGVPVQIQKVNVLVNRPGFTFNPTNCSPAQVTGTINSAEGASLPVSVPFQATNCAVLKFTPQFSVSTSGKTSKAQGASLNVKLAYPSAPFGSEANIASVKVELPKQLPSRLTTLQKACTAAQFAANPAGCPAASIVGHAIVHTPVLPVPLEGPAYFVSNGGEAFPNLVMVLQGYGVTVDLVGDTFINKAGVTSSTFKSTPDVPFSTFELNLPEGRFSALAANTNLCARTKAKTVRKRVAVRRRGRTLHPTRRVRELVPETLVMPTTIVAQNGARVERDTRIGVTGCAKAAKHRKARHRSAHRVQRRKK